MKKLLPLLAIVLLALVVAGVLYVNDYPLLPAHQKTFLLLYTGDVSGQVEPCPH